MVPPPPPPRPAKEVKAVPTNDTQLQGLIPGCRVHAWFYTDWHLASVHKVEGDEVEVLWESEWSISRLPRECIVPVGGVDGDGVGAARASHQDPAGSAEGFLSPSEAEAAASAEAAAAAAMQPAAAWEAYRAEQEPEEEEPEPEEEAAPPREHLTRQNCGARSTSDGHCFDQDPGVGVEAPHITDVAAIQCDGTTIEWDEHDPVLEAFIARCSLSPAELPFLKALPLEVRHAALAGFIPPPKDGARTPEDQLRRYVAGIFRQMGLPLPPALVAGSGGAGSVPVAKLSRRGGGKRNTISLEEFVEQHKLEDTTAAFLGDLPADVRARVLAGFDPRAAGPEVRSPDALVRGYARRILERKWFEEPEQAAPDKKLETKQGSCQQGAPPGRGAEALEATPSRKKGGIGTGKAKPKVKPKAQRGPRCGFELLRGSQSSSEGEDEASGHD